MSLLMTGACIKIRVSTRGYDLGIVIDWSLGRSWYEVTKGKKGLYVYYGVLLITIGCVYIQLGLKWGVQMHSIHSDIAWLIRHLRYFLRLASEDHHTSVSKFYKVVMNNSRLLNNVNAPSV